MTTSAGATKDRTVPSARRGAGSSAGSDPVSSSARRGASSAPEAGLGARLDAALVAVASVVSELDPARLTGEDATGLYSSLVGLERLTNAGKTLLAPRIEASGIWRGGGHRSAPVVLAAPGGGGVGPGRAAPPRGRGCPARARGGGRGGPGPEHPGQRAAPRTAPRHRGRPAH